MDVLFYIAWVLMLLVIISIGVGVPYMTLQNYRRIKEINRRIDGMCTGLGIMLRNDNENNEN